MKKYMVKGVNYSFRCTGNYYIYSKRKMISTVLTSMQEYTAEKYFSIHRISWDLLYYNKAILLKSMAQHKDAWLKFIWILTVGAKWRGLWVPIGQIL